MMIEFFVPLMKLTSGRRISVLNQMRTIARSLNQSALVARIEDALAHDVQTRTLDNQWAEPTRRSLYTPAVKEVDRYVDTGITSIRDLTEVQVRGLPGNHPLVVEANEMLRDIFPAGVAAVTSLPYVEEVAACEVIVAKLKDEWSGAVTRLGLGQRLAFLADYTSQYRELIDEHRNLTFATVQRHRQIGLQNLREVVILTLATYLDSRDPVQVEARERLLTPLVVQLKDMRLKARAQRGGGRGDDGDVGDGDVGDGDGDVQDGDGDVQGGVGPDAGPDAGDPSSNPETPALSPAGDRASLE